MPTRPPRGLLLYVAYWLRAPASCVLCVPEAQGSFLPGRQARHARRTRTSPGRIALRTTYGVPHRGSSGEARLKVYAGSRGGRAEATGGHVFELQRLQRALMQVTGSDGFFVSLILTYLLIRLVVAGMVYARGNSPTH